MKKIITLLASCAIAMSSWNVCLAADNKMTADEAVGYALENSLEVKKCNAAIQTAKYQSYQAKMSKDNISKMETVDSSTYLIATGYAYKAAQLQYTVSQRNAEDNKKAVAVQVKKDFYTYINSQAAVEIANQNLKNAEEKMASAKARLDNGSISQLDYKSFELIKKNAENSLKSAERTRDLNLIVLKNTMNYPLDKELVPVGSVEYTPEEITTPEKATELSRSTNKYLNISDSFSLAKERWITAGKHFTSALHDYKIEKATYETAEADYTLNVNSLDTSIRSTYNSLLTLAENLDYMQSNVELLKDTADAAYLKYEMGSMSASDYRDARQNFESAQNELQNLKLTYLTTKLSYDNIYTK